MLAVLFGDVRGTILSEEYEAVVKELCLLPEKIQEILGDKERIQWFASKYANAEHVFFIGRGVDYASSMEGSLKLKEISYIHSEAYAAGELKHGTISLIEDGVLTVAVSTQPELYEKMISNVVEVKTRGAYVFALVSEDNQGMKEVADFTVEIPKTYPCFAPSLSVIPLQLFGYYVSVAKGLDVDKPRNLAKSVTVE
jgi:glucosamine--fructose-6-phosphate aminotransferase (isomerizing)